MSWLMHNLLGLNKKKGEIRGYCSFLFLIDFFFLFFFVWLVWFLDFLFGVFGFWWFFDLGRFVGFVSFFFFLFFFLYSGVKISCWSSQSWWSGSKENSQKI